MAGLVELRGVGKRYDRSRTVLDDIDLVIYPGEVVGVIGGNGSGKSTLLRIVAGLSPVTSGRVIARPRVIGYVPERFPTQARISARSYLKHIGRIRGLGTRAALARADELLTRLALVGGANAELRRLSKGNAQKVAVAQALMVPPQLLVLDEPWSGLDAAAHEVLAELIAETAREGGAVVFTDHREAVVSASASVIYRIAGGRLSTAPSGEALAFVELVDSALDAPEPDWWRLPGVLEARRDDAVVTLEVVSKYADELIFQALGNGWSVQSVRRTAPVPVANRGDDLDALTDFDDRDAADDRNRAHDRDAAHDRDRAHDRNPADDHDPAHDRNGADDRDPADDRDAADRRDMENRPGTADRRDERDAHRDDEARRRDGTREKRATGADRRERADEQIWDDGRSRPVQPGDAWHAAGRRDDEPDDGGRPRDALPGEPGHAAAGHQRDATDDDAAPDDGEAAGRTSTPRPSRPNLKLVKDPDEPVAEEVR